MDGGKLEGRGGGGADLGTDGWVIRCGGRSAESVELHVVKCGVIIMSIWYLNSAFFEENKDMGEKDGKSKNSSWLGQSPDAWKLVGLENYF